MSTIFDELTSISFTGASYSSYNGGYVYKSIKNPFLFR